MEKNKKYNIGIDIGTNSVGWAVVETDTHKIIKKGKGSNRKALWGVRLFEKGETAESRRLARGTRRRYDRRRKRLKLLRREFAPYINEVDPTFFSKLNESFIRNDDLENKKIIMNDKELEEFKDLFRKFPTIYHLRERLINNPEKADIRHVYLAIHHIIKYRGNFLYDNNNFNVGSLNTTEKLNEIVVSLPDYFNEIDENKLEYIDLVNLEKAFFINSKTDKRKELIKLLKEGLPSTLSSQLTSLLIGNQFSISKLFEVELEEDIKLTFRGGEFDELLPSIEHAIGEKVEILEQLKELYDMIFLKALFKETNSTSLSSLMTSRYKKHGDTLKLIREILKHDKDEFHKVFTNQGDKICLYNKYLNNKELEYDYDKFKRDLQPILKKVIKNVNNEELLKKYKNNIESKWDQENILPKITDVDNGKYPYQLNKDELIKIIENQGKHYPELLKKVNGTYKLVKLLEFRIPYYVGPLNNSSDKQDSVNQNAWAIKRFNSKEITPYNFEDVIDIHKSAEEFIMRMVSKCTYLLNENAIPANSILYSKFKVLNELKQIKVNGDPLTPEQFKRVYENLFLNHSGTITEKVFIKFLQTDKDFDMFKEFDIKGYSADKKFANNMQTYVDFFGINGFFKGTDYQVEAAEEIIRILTIFEDTKIKKAKLKKYKLPEGVINALSQKRYKGWSNLSELLLTEKYYYDEKTKEKYSILDLLENTEYNFMQIINEEKFKFQEMIELFNPVEAKSKISYKLVKNLATSPAVKKGIYQALLVINEIVRYMGCDPDKIIIEMARGDEKKKRTLNRKDYISKLYVAHKRDIENYDKLNKKLKSYDKIDNQKLFLYFIQEGKCLYTGEELNVGNLTEYEIDHIIPRTLIKDDSIENKALVLRCANQEKGAQFVLPSKFRTYKQIKYWTRLRDNKLISPKKFYNLMRREFKNEDIQGFINRQLVETRQITKHVANIIKSHYDNTDVVYLHANFTHNYRDKFNLYKFRELNDHHHAHDAYLTAVLGEYKTKYLKNIDYEELKKLNQEFFEKKDFRKMRHGYVVNSLDNSFYLYNKDGEVLFEPKKFNKIVEDTLYRNDIIISKKTEIRKGELFNQTKNSKGKSGIPLKKNLPTELYGSYTSINPAYAALVKFGNKQRLVGIPIFLVNNKEGQLNYLRNLLKVKENDIIEIIKDKIPFYSVLNWDDQICMLVGASDKVEVINAKQFYIDSNNMKIWKRTLNRLLNGKKKGIDDVIYSTHLTEIIKYIIHKVEKEYKLYSNLISEMKEAFDYPEINHSLEEKEKIIIEMLKLLSVNSGNANLKFLGYSSAFGKKHGRSINNAKIIKPSITGIWESYDEF